MRFVLKMTARDMRAAWKRLIFFFVCVAIGVGAIVALRSVIQSVRHALGAEARTLIAADVLIQSIQPWSPEVLGIIDRRVLAIPGAVSTDAVETATMVRPADETKAVAKVVELRAVQPGFPLYGTLTLEGGRPYSHDLVANRGALVRPEVLAQLGLRVGEGLVIGRETFTIRGVIANEPGRQLSTFSFGPRVLIDHADLQQAGLLVAGSRARYQRMLRVPESAVIPLVRGLEAELRDRFVTARSYRNAEDRMGRNLQRVENYLSLVGFVILVLGGIGVWSVTRVFVQQKIKSIAILKCLGAGNREILGTYVLEVLLLGGGGSVLGVVLAAAAIAAIPDDLAFLPSQVSYGLTASATAQGVGVGLLVSLLFAVVPLLEVRHIKPLLLLRHEAARSQSNARLGWVARQDWLRLSAIVLVSGALVGLASWQAASLRAGLFVCLGFAGVTIVLHLAGAGLVRLVRPLSGANWFPLRHAVLNLTRPGNQTRVVLLAVGLGSFFILGIQALQANLLREFAIELRADGPDMFLIDIQQDQAEGVRRFLATVPGVTDVELLPVLRARVVGVQGRQINLENYDDVRGRGSLGREYVVTYRNALDRNEQVLAGRFWDTMPGGSPEVSIEESISERFRIVVGDRMRFDILGRVVEATVTSVRHVEWDDSRRGGFMFVFRPETLRDAPHTYVGVLDAPDDPATRARLQRDLVAKHPNVSAIDVREVIRTIERVVANATLAISVVGAIALLSGGLILVGAVAMTKFQRVYEAAIFKTLGATTRNVATMLVLEYGALGTLAGTIGAAGAVVLSWALSRYLLDIGWTPAIGQNTTGILATALAVGAVGVAASLDVLRKKPLATLRAE
jgi:putative ABC transport system permease protein